MDFTPSSLFACLVVSAVGFALFTYGRKQHRVPQLATGVLLMVFPYFVGGAGLVLGIGAGLVVALWIGVRSGL